MSDYFQNQQTPLHDGGVIPNLTDYREESHADNSFASADQVFADPGDDPSGGVHANITDLRAG